MFYILSRILQFSLVLIMIFGAAVLGLCSHDLGKAAQIWPANGLFLSILLTYPHFRRLSCWLGAGCAYIFASWIMGDPLAVNLCLTLTNLCGVAAGFSIFQCLEKRQDQGFEEKHLFHVLLVCAGAATTTGVVVACLSKAFLGWDPKEQFALWLSSELNRYLEFLPLFLSYRVWAPKNTSKIEAIIADFRKNGIALPAILAGSVMLGFLIGGPGTIAFPAPALIGCALVYDIVPMCIIILVFNTVILSSVQIGLLKLSFNMSLEETIISFRLGLSFLLFGPFTIAGIMATQRRLLSRLEQSVTWDSLTGVLNRQAYLDQSNTLIDNTVWKPTHSIAFLLIDLDHFKKINDTYGHFAGDVALTAVSKEISLMLPPGALCGRLGGEEFAVTILQEREDNSHAISEKIRRAIELLEIILENGTSIHLTASIGLYTCKSCNGINVFTGLKNADFALYHAKSNGRNHVSQYYSSPNEKECLPSGLSRLVFSPSFS